MLSKIINGLMLVYVLQRFPVNCYSGNSALNKSSASRHKRTLNFYFEYNSCYAVSVWNLSLETELNKIQLEWNCLAPEISLWRSCIFWFFNLYSKFTISCEFQLAVVLSLPLEDLPAGRSAFCSYNFETNFYFPYFDNANGLVPLPFTYVSIVV